MHGSMPPGMFALNHIVASKSTTAEFFALARSLGIDAVELRNDLPGIALQDQTSPSAVGTDARREGVRILSINALQRFNDWNGEREAQALALIASAVACGAESIVLCPVNDASLHPTDEERRAALLQALDRLAPLLRAAGIVGLIEPLGFAECSLRLKREAAGAIRAVADDGTFLLLHDTFHHYVSGETEFFPEMTGLVHISGVTDPAAHLDNLRDPHRVLVDRHDRIDTVGQIRTLLAQGYRGVFSFEPFSEAVTFDPHIASKLRHSMETIHTDVNAPA